LLLQLRCAHLVPAKAPLPEKEIFNRKKVATERQRAARKAQHKEHEIAKRDQNDNHIKRQKVGERDVSCNEDPSSESSWSGDVASAAVDWSDMSGSSSSSPPRATEVLLLRRPQIVVREKNVGASSQIAARPAREDQRVVRPHVAPSGTSAPEAQRASPRQADPFEAVGGAASSNAPSLRRLRPPRLELPAEAPVVGVVDRLSVDTERATAGGGQGLTPAAAEVGRSTPMQSGECSAAVEVADQRGAAPELVGSKCVAPEQGSSGRLAKKSGCAPKCKFFPQSHHQELFNLFCLLILVLSSRRHADTSVPSLVPLKRLALSARVTPSEPLPQPPYAEPLLV
jgi:hypothetical protein